MSGGKAYKLISPLPRISKPPKYLSEIRSSFTYWWTRTCSLSKFVFKHPWHRIKDTRSASPEEPKELFIQGYASSLLQCLVHLLSLGITAFVLQLNFRNIYWADSTIPNLNALLDAFQFASKLYESLICASLLSMVIYVSKSKICNGGIPLGSLISSYEINNLSHLWNSAFWSGLLVSPKSSPWQHRLYSFLLGLSAFLAAIIGPFTAIALIPRLDWWPYRVSDASTLTSSYFTPASRSQIWPMDLSGSSLPTEECLSPNATENVLCPAAGYSLISQKLSSSSFGPLNLTIPGNKPWEGPRLLTSNPNFHYGYYDGNSDSDGTISTSISQILARDLGLICTDLSTSTATTPLYKLSSLNGFKPFKPVVQVLCKSFSPNTTMLEFPHYALNTPPFVPYNTDGAVELPLANMYRDMNWTMDVNTVWNRTLLEEQMRTGNLSFTWVDLQEYALKPSIATAIAFPPVDSTTTNDSNTQNLPSRIFACSIDARWLPADLWITPTLSNSYYESVPEPQALLNSLSDTSMELDEEPINISLEWANALNLPALQEFQPRLSTIENLLTIANATSFSHYGWCETCPSEYDLPTVESTLALFVADGLARVGLNYDIYTAWVQHINNDDTASDVCVACQGETVDDNCDACSERLLNISSIQSRTDWNIEIYQYGYGYGLTNTTSKIAAGVLIIYGVIAMIAIVSIVVRNCNSDSWSSLGELLILAMNSPPTEVLRNTGAGVGRLNTWKEIVKVRVTEEDKIQMVFESDEKSEKCYDRRPKVGEKYE